MDRSILQNLPLFPRQASTMAAEVDALYLAWLLIAGFFSTLIAVLLFTFFVRFRRRLPDDIGQVEQRSNLLETIWIVVPLLISLAMFVWGARVYFALRRPPAEAVEYFGVGKQWMWKFQHPDGTREINDLHVPVDQPIRLTLTSEDVIHSFFVPAFRVKMDVIPGRYTEVWFEADRTGAYRLFCTEYCGVEHSLMGGVVHVLEQHDYERWLLGEAEGGGADAPGEALFAELACDTCHVEGDASRGPTLRGLYGTTVELASGASVLADEAYLRESILDPGAKLLAGFAPLMPTYRGQVSEEEVLDLVQFIRTLGESSPRASLQRGAGP